jgi:hypothetical protein
VKKGTLDIRERVQVQSVKWENECWKVRFSDKRTEFFDLIWLGTGSVLDVTKDPCLSHMLEKFPIEVVHGLPVLQDDLRWCNDCNLYLMSGYSALSVGPIAGNLLGGKVCSERIADSIWKDWAKELGGDLVDAEADERKHLISLSDMAANLGNYWTALEAL